jgi:hypothetical protein
LILIPLGICQADGIIQLTLSELNVKKVASRKLIKSERRWKEVTVAERVDFPQGTHISESRKAARGTHLAVLLINLCALRAESRNATAPEPRL